MPDFIEVVLESLKKPQPSPFTFGLDESAELSKRWLETFGVNCPEFGRVVEHWKTVKAPLIQALDPLTGRVEVKIDNAKTLDGLHDACDAHGVGVLKELLDGTDAAEEKVTAGSKLMGRYPEIKEGEKLSRAINKALVRRLGFDDKKANDTSAKIIDSWRAGTSGTFVLSANILDILMSSWHASFKSCHRPEGESSGGPQQYLADSQTLVAYFYAETRPEDVTGAELPYKTWRQLVHIDFANRGGVFMKEYGTTLSDSTHKPLRKMTAQLIARVCGLDRDEDPGWLIRRDNKECNVTFHDACGGPAYPDAWRSVISVGSKMHDYAVQFAKEIPCPGCGVNIPYKSWARGRLYHCRGLTPCCGCGVRLPDGGVMWGVVEGIRNAYCRHCYEKNFFGCQSCGNPFHVSATLNLAGLGRCCLGCARDKVLLCIKCHLYLRNTAVTIKYPNARCVCRNCSADWHACMVCAKRSASNSEHSNRRPDMDEATYLVCPDCSKDFYNCRDCGEEYYYAQSHGPRAEHERHRCESCAAAAAPVPHDPNPQNV